MMAEAEEARQAATDAAHAPVLVVARVRSVPMGAEAGATLTAAAREVVEAGTVQAEAASSAS